MGPQLFLASCSEIAFHFSLVKTKVSIRRVIHLHTAVATFQHGAYFSICCFPNFCGPSFKTDSHQAQRPSKRTASDPLYQKVSRSLQRNEVMNAYYSSKEECVVTRGSKKLLKSILLGVVAGAETWFGLLGRRG